MAGAQRPERLRLKAEDLVRAASRVALRGGANDALVTELAVELAVDPAELQAYFESLKPKVKRPGLDRRRIVDAAIRVAESGGLEELTLRRVATELGVTPMALYRYVESKDALLDAMVAQLFGEVVFEEAEGASWQQTIRGLLDAIREVLVAHPAVVTMLVTRPVALGAETARLRDIAIGALRRAGLAPRSAFELFDLLVNLTGALMLREASLSQGSNYVAASRDERLRRLHEEVAAYPAGMYPHLAEAMEFWTEPPDPEHEFARGVEILISGLEAEIDAARGFASS